MRRRTDKTIATAAWLVTLSFMTLVLCGGDALAGPGKPKLPPIYDNKADGDQQIADALVRANLAHKRILLQFGANWCVWCHRLHDILNSDSKLKSLIRNEFEFVLIDVDQVEGERHNAALEARMGKPTKKGLPVLVVLNQRGIPLTTIYTEPLELGDSYDVKKVFAALDKWKPKQVSAQEVMSDALKRAKSEGKNVFVYFSAPWCSWCTRMAAYLGNDTTGKTIQTSFVAIKIDVERMVGGEAMGEKYGRTDEDGLPFFAVLDAAGKKLADSHAPTGNVGFPAESFEIKHFMDVIKTHGKGLSAEQLKVLEDGLITVKP